jgi:hypothetical protein
MADNVAITAGSGTTIHTDETASGHIQIVKLADGTADSTARIPGDATNGLDVDVTRVSGNVTVVQSTASSLKAEVVGAVAHDSPVSTPPPINNAGVATTSLVANTAVANDDISYLRTTTDGRVLVHPYGSPENIVSGAITNTDGASTAVIAAGAAGVRTYLTTISIQNSSAAGVAVQIKDGTTVMAELWAPGGGGVVLNLPVPLRGSAATAWNVDAGAATTTIYATFVGYQSKV